MQSQRNFQFKMVFANQLQYSIFQSDENTDEGPEKITLPVRHQLRTQTNCRRGRRRREHLQIRGALVSPYLKEEGSVPINPPQKGDQIPPKERSAEPGQSTQPPH